MSLKGGRVADHRRMIVRLDTHRLQTLDQVREFPSTATPRRRLRVGLLRSFLSKATGLSRAQVTLLLAPTPDHGRDHRPPLHPRRHRVAGRDGRAARHAVRPGQARPLCARLAPVCSASTILAAWRQLFWPVRGDAGQRRMHPTACRVLRVADARRGAAFWPMGRHRAAGCRGPDDRKRSRGNVRSAGRRVRRRWSERSRRYVRRAIRCIPAGGRPAVPLRGGDQRVRRRQAFTPLCMSTLRAEST